MKPEGKNEKRRREKDKMTYDAVPKHSSSFGAKSLSIGTSTTPYVETLDRYFEDARSKE